MKIIEYYDPINIYELLPPYLRYMDIKNEYPYLLKLFQLVSKYTPKVEDEPDNQTTVFDELLALTDNLPNLLNPDMVPINLIDYLANYVGIENWGYIESEEEKRNYIDNIIYYYQRKGTLRHINDLLNHYDINDYQFINQIDNIASTSFNGKLSYDNCYLENSNYYHEGSFVIILNYLLNHHDILNFNRMTGEISNNIPAGTKVHYIIDIDNTYDINDSQIQFEITF